MVDLTTPFNPFFIVPEFNVPETPVSNASVQPSPSESKSKRFGIPSLSVSRSIQFLEILRVVPFWVAPVLL